jgi:hypothetical protein
LSNGHKRRKVERRREHGEQDEPKSAKGQNERHATGRAGSADKVFHVVSRAARGAPKRLAVVALGVCFQAFSLLRAWAGLHVGALDDGVAFGPVLTAATQHGIVYIKSSLNHGS